MITRIEALNYRCLRQVSQPLVPFTVLVGPNASGKSTFLDVVAFLGRLVADGLDAAIDERTQNFQDLVWGRTGTQFALAIEARIPDEVRQLLAESRYNTIRYEVLVLLNPKAQTTNVAERVLLKAYKSFDEPRSSDDADFVFSNDHVIGFTINEGQPVLVKGLAKDSNDRIETIRLNDYFIPETQIYKGIERVTNSQRFRFGPRKSALANLPDDPTNFPATTWLKNLLTDGIQQMTLNSEALRRPSPPGRGRRFRADGSNLPWVVEDLATRDATRFAAWIAHLQTALPDLTGIRTVEREEDRHRYLMLRYGANLEVPSWSVSDGTLRLLALTLPAYLPDLAGVFLIEEPENGIHPRAIETALQSLTSVYDAQILLATHSPVVLSLVDPATVLCFAKGTDEATTITAGTDLPALRDWHGAPNLGLLFAGGVLG